ncbi:MAG: 2-iminobutanoate/2-iminopropanoate deaminase [Spirosomataceae bacterium]|jgi:2-iminobutanoate/2-iminopropanoate deaminase
MNKKIVLTDKSPAPIGPYSQAVMANGTLYISGQIALSVASSGDIALETKAVMENMGHILEAAGMTFANVVKCGIFLKDMDDFTTVNEVYGTFFDEQPPARETVQVSRLPKDVNVEISAIAVV